MRHACMHVCVRVCECVCTCMCTCIWLILTKTQVGNFCTFSAEAIFLSMESKHVKDFLFLKFLLILINVRMAGLKLKCPKSCMILQNT